MKWSPFLFAVLAPVLCFGGSPFQTQFQDDLNRGDMPRLESTLASWKISSPEDPDLLSAYGLFYFRKAVRGKRREEAKFSPRTEINLNRPRNPPFREHLDSQTLYDRKTLLKGVKTLKRAVEKYPRRMDLRLDLARFYGALGDFEAQYLVLAETLQFLDKNRQRAQWINNGDLPDRPSRFLPDLLQDFETYYFNQQGMDSDEKGFRLAKLTLTYFPRHPAAYNSIAAYYSFINDWEHALKYLLLANRRDPADSVVLNNIGKTMIKFDKKEEARIYFRKVVALDNDEENCRFAKKQLEDLMEP